MIDREILFRKFQVTKKSNHRKHIPHHRHRTLETFKPHKKIVMGMLRCERIHKKTNPKATLKLIRLEKKWLSLKGRLEGMAGVR